jgi:hypothetical protein
MVTMKAPEPSELVFDNFFGKLILGDKENDWEGVDKYQEAHPIGVMTSLMAYASAAIGNNPTITTIEGTLTLAFWPILCGRSGGGGKGKATRAAEAIYKAALQGESPINKKDGFDTGLGVIKILHESKDEKGRTKPLLIFQNEVSKLIRSLASDGKMGAVFTNLADGDTLRYSTSKDEWEIENPYAVVLGHVQPKMFLLTRNSRAAATGVWNRFLFFHVEKSKTLDLFAGMAGKVQAIREASYRFLKAFTYARHCGDVTVPPNVAKVFARRHRPAVEALVNQTAEINEYAQRGEAYLIKVAALYAIFDGRNSVTVKDFDSALALIEYSIASIKFVLSSAAGFSGRTSLAQKVLRTLDEHGEPMTYSALKAKCGGTNTKPTFVRAFLELGDEVVVFEKPMKGRGYRGGWMVAAKGQPLPEGFTLVPLEDPDIEVSDTDDPEDHPNFRVPEDDVTVEAEIIVEEPESTPEPLKALPGPKPPKATPKPAQATTEPPKAKHQPRRDTSTKVMPTRRPAPHKPATESAKPAGMSWF